MTAVFNFFRKICIRSGLRPDLIFFALTCFAGCRQQEDSSISVIEKDGKAIAVSVPGKLIKTDWDEIVPAHFRLTLKGNHTAILADNTADGNRYLIRPLLPLVRGADYVIDYSGQTVGTIRVPPGAAQVPPKLVSVFPSLDTVPENLLKIYLQFSAAMREGEALRHVHLVSNSKDTLPDVFLDLQPELWNKERTVLTLWLDPGRIKRDLIPNRKLGNPLREGEQYQIVVSSDWKNGEGMALEKSSGKTFFVGRRDSLGPEPQTWKINPPAAGSSQSLKVSFSEGLDYFLIGETITIWHGQTKIEGRMNIAQGETMIEFVPEQPWQKGDYILRVATALEDLAGNNLNRPFDRDVLMTKEKPRRDYDMVRFRIGGIP